MSFPKPYPHAKSREGQKVKANKRQSKALRMRELLLEGRALDKDAAARERRLGYTARRLEQAFRGCEL